MTFRSFTLNLSIILCKYFLKACATMTLISQFKSKFKTDCKAMSYELACRLPHFIFEHLMRRNQEALSQSPASCLPSIQIPWQAEEPFRFPRIKIRDNPLFSPLVLAHLHPFTQARLTHSAKWSLSSLTSRVPQLPLLDPTCAAEWQPVQTKPWGRVFKSAFP